MDYDLERLGDERFQKLCQAMLVTLHPSLQAVPLNQADGGRDAFLPFRTSNSKGLLVFQVKFSNTPRARTERDALIALVRQEKAKVLQLIERGAKEYHFLTNIAGTAALDVGSIDTVNEILTKEFGIPSYCWWRDDIERRIDVNTDLRWSYPEILRGTDVLQLLVTSRFSEPHRDTALRAYLTTQFENDEEVKFKQVELQNKLISLFVDVPSVFNTDGIVDPETAFGEPWSAHRLYDSHSDPMGAATRLLLQQKLSGLQRIVLEGAPGQGKSTITQYIAQVHRMHFLGKQDQLDQIDARHRACPTRIPVRIDLRDYSYWVSGNNPFGVGTPSSLPAGTPKALESFIAAHITDAAGGLQFSVGDFSAIIRESHLLIVLDGFDEVADVTLRDELIKEISRATSRLEGQCASLQIIVTSRPSAFANSPGFPKKEWPHLDLKALTPAVIDAYARNWMNAKNLAPKEQGEFSRVLGDRLQQTHIRDLARNPMQLAILLSLINTKGLSLPDKRTALYDSYVELFFNREAEKNTTVRDHRDLLISIHQYLAWLLQTEAEVLRGRGSIEATRLKMVLRSFLANQGHDPSLVDTLFTGMIERVVAIVERQLGSYEFEVQPLREYFAARYLYETAKYAPATREQRGTKPDRLRAIAKSFYWLNVTRFYAGCYSAGELSSLVDGIQEQLEEPPFSNLTHPRTLAFMLLTDWVFSHQPLVVRRLVDLLVKPENLKLLVAAQTRVAQQANISLPEGAGRHQFAAGLQEALSKPQPRDYRQHLAAALVQNSTVQQRAEWWLTLEPEEASPRVYWWSLGAELDAIDAIDATTLLDLVSKHGKIAAHFVIHSRRPWLLHAKDEFIRMGIEIAFSGGVNFAVPNLPSGDSILRSVAVLTYFASAVTSFRAPAADDASFADVASYYGTQAPHFPSAIPLSPSGTTQGDVQILSKAFDTLSKKTLLDLVQSIDSWNEVVEPLRIRFGEKYAIRRLAIAAAGARQPSKLSKQFSLFDSSLDLCLRAHAARRRGSTWWKNCVDTATCSSDLQFAVVLAFSWSSLRVTEELAQHLSDRLEAMPESDWTSLFNVLSDRTPVWRRDTVRKDRPDFPSAAFGPRAAALLSLRSTQPRRYAIQRAYLDTYAGTDVTIRELSTEILIERAHRAPSAWRAAVAAIRALYHSDKINERWLVRGYGEFSKSRIPVSVARSIADERDNYPLELLMLADAVLAAHAGRTVPKVGETAVAEGWDH